MSTTMISVRTERTTKETAQRLAHEMGVPLGTIINAYLKNFVREERVVLSVAPEPNARLQRVLDGIRKEAPGKTVLRSPRVLQAALDKLKG